MFNEKNITMEASHVMTSTSKEATKKKSKSINLKTIKILTRFYNL